MITDEPPLCTIATLCTGRLHAPSGPGSVLLGLLRSMFVHQQLPPVIIQTCPEAIPGLSCFKTREPAQLASATSSLVSQASPSRTFRCRSCAYTLPEEGTYRAFSMILGSTNKYFISSPSVSAGLALSVGGTVSTAEPIHSPPSYACAGKRFSYRSPSWGRIPVMGHSHWIILLTHLYPNRILFPSPPQDDPRELLAGLGAVVSEYLPSSVMPEKVSFPPRA